MFEFRVIDDKEQEMFDRFVAEHPKGHVLQTWAWGQVKKSMGWVPLAAVLQEEGVVKAAILILKRRLPLPGISRSIFYAPRGPVADVHDERIMNQLLAGVRRLARQHGAIFLKIDPDIQASDNRFREYLLRSGFRKTVTAEGFEGVQPTYVFRLDIDKDEEELLSQMSSKTRYNLRLAQRKGVVVREAESKEDLKTFYQILEETAARDRFLIRGYSYFEEIWDQMVVRDMARVFLAYYQGLPISGALALTLGKKTWYLYGASSNEYRNVMPNYLIQWSMIQWARQRGCTLYDFRGVSGDLSEDNPLFGLYRFKKGFGGEFTEFIGEWDIVYDPVFYWLWNRVLPVYYRTMHRLAGIKKKMEGKHVPVRE